MLSALPEWTESALHDALMGLAAEKGVKNGQMLWPVRTALSGKPTSPGGAIELAYLLGREETLKRLEQGLRQLSA